MTEEYADQAGAFAFEDISSFCQGVKTDTEKFRVANSAYTTITHKKLDFDNDD